MIKALIIDDEPLARSVVREYLQDYPQVEIVGECGDGFEGVKAISAFDPQLIFLDIQMPKITGFEMLELLPEPPSVIFTTAYDEYALKAFETHAIDYLLKPFSKERFKKALDNWLQQQEQQVKKTQQIIESAAASPLQHERVVVKISGKIKIIPVQEILFIEAADDYVKIYTAEGAFLKNKTLGYFEKVLGEELFVRTHRSYILNVGEVSKIEPYEKESYLAILRNGNKVPVSKNGYSRLREVLGL